MPVAAFVAAMCAVVAASNYLVQFPVRASVGGLDLADLLTWGAFTYPVAFLVTDLTNRRFGPGAARLVVLAGFALAVAVSIVLATPRIALASGSAFLVAQLLDVAVFNRLREAQWWQAPLISSVIGSVVDTAIFFSIAFAPAFAVFGANDAFAIEAAPLLGAFAAEVPRYVSWALGDLGVKLIVGLAMLVPYGLLLRLTRPPRPLAGHGPAA
nr:MULTISPECIES: queuosine precursor transporter [unclassified Roseitalea]